MGFWARERSEGHAPLGFLSRQKLPFPSVSNACHTRHLSICGGECLRKVSFPFCHILSSALRLTVWGKKISFRQAPIVYCWPLCESFNKETFFRVDERFKILSSRGGCCVLAHSHCHKFNCSLFSSSLKGIFQACRFIEKEENKGDNQFIITYP